MGNVEKRIVWLPRVNRRQLIVGAGAAWFLAACGDDDDDTSAASPRPERPPLAQPARLARPVHPARAGRQAPRRRYRAGDDGSRGRRHPRRHAAGRSGRVDQRPDRRPVHRRQARPGPPDRRLGDARQLRRRLQHLLRPASPRKSRPRPPTSTSSGSRRASSSTTASRSRPTTSSTRSNAGSTPSSGLPGARRAARRQRLDQGRRPNRRGPAQTAGGDFINGLAEYTATIVPAATTPSRATPATRSAPGRTCWRASRRATRASSEEPELLGRRPAVLRRGADHRLRRPRRSSTPSTRGQIDAAVDIPFGQVATIESNAGLRLLDVGRRAAGSRSPWRSTRRRSTTSASARRCA